MNSDYILEFRSIDPARRYCESSDKPHFIHGFNQNALDDADKSIEPSALDNLKEGFGKNKKLSFLIKPYQRGFRWDAHNNVRKLLDDLFSYSEENSDLFEKTRINYLHDFTDAEFDFYCLQTLTLKSASEEGKWEVIDGQQRLTCMFLIYMVLSFFCPPDDASVNAPYEIIYQREGENFSLSERISRYFCKLSDRKIQYRDILSKDLNLTEPEKADRKKARRKKADRFKKLKKAVDNLFNEEKDATGSCKIDYYYVRSAMIEAISFVSEGKDQKQIETLLECIKRNVYFLWYVVPEVVPEDSELSSVNVFLKINSGAIPLTNAELIKSLVLRNSGTELGQNSRKWEALERGLSEDELWSFIAGNFNSDTRIELLLDVYAREKNSDEKNGYSGNTSNNPYALFDWYNEYSKSNESFVKNVLKGIQDIYDRVTEWYDDVEAYHFVGLLTVYLKLGFRFDDGYENQQEMLKLLLSEAENEYSKDKFIQELKMKILECLKDGLKDGQIPGKAVDMVECPDGYNNDYLNYNDDSKRIEAILWLFNVWETVESADNKTEYKKGQFKYKNNICRRFPFSEALSGNWSLEHIFPQQPDDNDKENLKRYRKITEKIDKKKRLKEKCLKEEDVHSIKNLVLLKKKTNTLLQNEMLNIKRSRLIAEISKGSFVPCSTVNAFMLYYNIDCSKKDTETENLQIDDDWNYWTVDDADKYEQAIIKCLKKIEEQSNVNEKDGGTE